MKHVLFQRNRLQWGIYLKVAFHPLTTFLSGLLNGVIPIDLNYKPKAKENHNLSVTEDNFRTLTYKGMNLFDLCNYSICVSTNTFITDLTFKPEEEKIKHWFAVGMDCIDEIEKLFTRYSFEKVILFQE